jgi:hypothetical protein
MAARIVHCFGHSVKDEERMKKGAILATRPTRFTTHDGRPIEQLGKSERYRRESPRSLPRRARRAMEFRHSLGAIGSRCCEKGKGDSPVIRPSPLGDYFVCDFFSVISPFFSMALSGFAALLLDSALTELAIIFPSFSV